jgi:hypothetical protein
VAKALGNEEGRALGNEEGKEVGNEEEKAQENEEGKATGSESCYVQRKKDVTLFYRNAHIYVGWGDYLNVRF